MRFLRIAGAGALVALAAFVALCAGLEMAARVYLWHFASKRQFQTYASIRQLHERAVQGGTALKPYTAHRYIGYIPAPNYAKGLNHHNSLGYRGEEIVVPKPKNAFRIVCIGGSTTYTPGVQDWHSTYPSRLEKDLRQAGFNVRVVNAGAESWMSYAALINFELRVRYLDPDMVIVSQGIEDTIGRFVWPPEAYRGDNSGVKRATVSSVYMPGIFEYSTFLRMILIRMGWSRPMASTEETLNTWQPTFVGLPLHNGKAYASRYQKEQRKVSVREVLTANPPVYFRRNLENLAVVAKSEHIMPLFAPVTTCPGFSRFSWVNDPAMARALAETNTVIKEVAADTGSEYFDLAAEFPRTKSYFCDGCHVSKKGAQLKARLFARFILGHHLIPDVYRTLRKEGSFQ